MKRALILSLIPLALLRLPASAQDTSGAAAAIAAREAADERYNRLAADLQAVQSDNEALHAKITSLEQQIQAVRDAQTRPSDNSGTQDELKKLAQAIQEVDKKRIEDKDAIAEEIRLAIHKLDSGAGGPPPFVPGTESTKSSPPQTGTEAPPAGDGYSYTIKAGDTLGEILQAYNKDFKSRGLKTVSLRQAMEANPNVNWGKLKVNQKIIIPKPPGG